MRFLGIAKTWLVIFVGVCLLAGCPRAQTVSKSLTTWGGPGDFFVHDNDVWVQAGDSITWQALYTTYLEAFIRARYPKLNFVAVNSGKSGEVTIEGLIRFNRTMAVFKPTLITSAYGMNDHVKTFGGEPKFENNPKSAAQRFVDATQQINTRYAIISASPLLAPADYGLKRGAQNADGAIVFSANRSNPINKLFVDKMKVVAARNGVPYLDQMTPLQIIWAQNYLRDKVAAMRHGLLPVLNKPIEGAKWRAQAAALTGLLKPFLGNSELANTLPAPDKTNLLARWKQPKNSASDWEAFRQYLQGWAKLVDESTPPFVQVSGYTNSSRLIDLVHPNEAGHLHMAGVLFKLMGGDGLVSSVAIDVNAKAKRSDIKAIVRDVVIKDGVLSFKRLDDSLPLPIDALARPALGVDVSTPLGTPKDLFGMSRYLLTVRSLPNGNYEIAIDSEVVRTATAAELARGVDLGLMNKGPIWAQTQKLLQAVKANIIMDVPEKGRPVAPSGVVPRVLQEAQPLEHLWSVRPVK